MSLRLRTIAPALFVLAGSTMARPVTADAQKTVVQLWPHGTPEPVQTTEPEIDVTKPTDPLLNGHRSVRLTNVTVPQLTVYPPAHGNNGAAVLVFPGGGYLRLAYTGEGTDACDWINSMGMTCVLVKYRVPEKVHYPDNPADLEDAQQAMRITRAHAAEWHIDPKKVGVAGFSAGGNLAVLLGTHPDDMHVASTPAAADVPGVHGKLNGDAMLTDAEDANANFAIVVYPAYLAMPPEQTELDPAYAPSRFTPPTFLAQAENDKTYGKNAIVYYRALMDANVPAELHYYATGGHGFGVHPVGEPEHWTELAEQWLRAIGMLPPLPHHPVGPATSTAAPNSLPGSLPCPMPQASQPGRPTNQTVQADPNCPQ